VPWTHAKRIPFPTNGLRPNRFLHLYLGFRIRLGEPEKAFLMMLRQSYRSLNVHLRVF
jgi:hypothetical protein